MNIFLKARKLSSVPNSGFFFLTIIFLGMDVGISSSEEDSSFFSLSLAKINKLSWLKEINFDNPFGE